MLIGVRHAGRPLDRAVRVAGNRSHQVMVQELVRSSARPLAEPSEEAALVELDLIPLPLHS